MGEEFTSEKPLEEGGGCLCPTMGAVESIFKDKCPNPNYADVFK